MSQPPTGNTLQQHLEHKVQTNARNFLSSILKIKDHTGRTERSFLFESIFRILKKFAEHSARNEEKYFIDEVHTRNFMLIAQNKNFAYANEVKTFFEHMAVITPAKTKGSAQNSDAFKALINKYGKLKNKKIVDSMRTALVEFIVLSVYLFTRKIRESFDKSMPSPPVYDVISQTYEKFLKVLSVILFGDENLLYYGPEAVHLLGYKFGNRSPPEELMFILNRSYLDFEQVIKNMMDKFSNHLHRQFSTLQDNLAAYVQFFSAMLEVDERVFKTFVSSSSSASSAVVGSNNAGGGLASTTMKRTKNTLSAIRKGAKHYTRKAVRVADRRSEAAVNAAAERLFSKSKRAWGTYFFKGMRDPLEPGALGVRAYLMLKQKTLSAGTGSVLNISRDYRLFPDYDADKIAMYIDWANEKLLDDVTTFTEHFHNTLERRKNIAKNSHSEKVLRQRFYELFFMKSPTGDRYFPEGSEYDVDRRNAFIMNVKSLFCTTPFLYKRRALEAFLAITQVDNLALMTMIYSGLQENTLKKPNYTITTEPDTTYTIPVVINQFFTPESSKEAEAMVNGNKDEIKQSETVGAQNNSSETKVAEVGVTGKEEENTRSSALATVVAPKNSVSESRPRSFFAQLLKG